MELRYDSYVNRMISKEDYINECLGSYPNPSALGEQWEKLPKEPPKGFIVEVETKETITKGENKWKRYRFKTYSIDDYRPLVFNPKYPWWCSGENNRSATIICWLPKDEDLNVYWDDADDIEFTEHESIEFSPRFDKPDYFIDS